MDTINLGNRQLAYRRYGRAEDPARPPLVLIHGAGGNHLLWPAQVRHLPRTTVYALDLPGHGASPGPGCASISAYTEVVRDFVDALELPWFVVAGHSMGGAIALDFALAYDHRIAGVGLLASGARLRVSSKLIDTTLHDFDAATEFIVEHSYSAETPAEAKELYLRHLRENDPHVLHTDFVACQHFDATDRVGSLAARALIIVGAQDQMTPPPLSRFLHEQIRSSELHVIERASHNVMIEQPEAVASILAGFIDLLAQPDLAA